MHRDGATRIIPLTYMTRPFGAGFFYAEPRPTARPEHLRHERVQRRSSSGRVSRTFPPARDPAAHASSRGGPRLPRLRVAASIPVVLSHEPCRFQREAPREGRLDSRCGEHADPRPRPGSELPQCRVVNPRGEPGGASPFPRSPLVPEGEGQERATRLVTPQLRETPKTCAAEPGVVHGAARCSTR